MSGKQTIGWRVELPGTDRDGTVTEPGREPENPGCTERLLVKDGWTAEGVARFAAANHGRILTRIVRSNAS